MPVDLLETLTKQYALMVKHKLIPAVTNEKEMLKELTGVLSNLKTTNQVPLSLAIMLKVGQKTGDPKLIAGLDAEWVKLLNQSPEKAEASILKFKDALLKLSPEAHKKLMEDEKEWRNKNQNAPLARNSPLIQLLITGITLKLVEAKLNEINESLFQKNTFPPTPRPRNEIDELLQRDDVKAILKLTGEYAGICSSMITEGAINAFGVNDENPEWENDPLSKLDKEFAPGSVNLSGEPMSVGNKEAPPDSPQDGSSRAPRPTPFQDPYAPK